MYSIYETELTLITYVKSTHEYTMNTLVAFHKIFLSVSGSNNTFSTPCHSHPSSTRLGKTSLCFTRNDKNIVDFEKITSQQYSGCSKLSGKWGEPDGPLPACIQKSVNWCESSHQQSSSMCEALDLVQALLKQRSMVHGLENLAVRFGKQKLVIAEQCFGNKSTLSSKGNPQGRSKSCHKVGEVSQWG